MGLNELTADQARERNIAAMGEELGSIYSQLWQELTWLYRTWAEYVILFGTKESRVELMNKSAPAFTRIVQDSLWEGIVLNIARLTDPPKSVGKRNLSIRALEEAVMDSELKLQMSEAVTKVLSASEFCRDWRNRHLAHRDLNLALKRGAEPLLAGSRQKVSDALASLSDVLNVLSLKYIGATTFFDIDLRIGGSPGGATSLLYYIDMGIEAEKKRHERLKRGNFDSSDYRPKDL